MILAFWWYFLEECLYFIFHFHPFSFFLSCLFASQFIYYSSCIFLWFNSRAVLKVKFLLFSKKKNLKYRTLEIISWFTCIFCWKMCIIFLWKLLNWYVSREIRNFMKGRILSVRGVDNRKCEIKLNINLRYWEFQNNDLNLRTIENSIGYFKGKVVIDMYLKFLLNYFTRELGKAV